MVILSPKDVPGRLLGGRGTVQSVAEVWSVPGKISGLQKSSYDSSCQKQVADRLPGVGNDSHLSSSSVGGHSEVGPTAQAVPGGKFSAKRDHSFLRKWGRGKDAG